MEEEKRKRCAYPPVDIDISDRINDVFLLVTVAIVGA